MAAEVVQPPRITGRRVSAETLTVAPAVLGQPLAEPWRRAAAMAVDLVAVALLSFLSKPILALGTGILLLVLLGNSPTAPAVLRTFRWICRGLGGLVILLAALALGHGAFLRDGSLNLEAFTGPGESAAMKRTVTVAPDASWGQLRSANTQLQEQVEPSGAEDGRIDDVAAIGRAQHEHALKFLDAVHLRQELATTRCVAALSPPPLAGTRLSISSKNRMHGEACRALRKTSRTPFSDAPTH